MGAKVKSVAQKANNKCDTGKTWNLLYQIEGLKMNSRSCNIPGLFLTGYGFFTAKNSNPNLRVFFAYTCRC